MRTTVRIDHDLMERLKAQARRENASLSRLTNRILRAGLKASAARPRKRMPYREAVYSLGTPQVALYKALAPAGALDDEEVLRGLALPPAGRDWR